jgi:hypothetical protein
MTRGQNVAANLGFVALCFVVGRSPTHFRYYRDELLGLLAVCFLHYLLYYCGDFHLSSSQVSGRVASWEPLLSDWTVVRKRSFVVVSPCLVKELCFGRHSSWSSIRRAASEKFASPEPCSFFSAPLSLRWVRMSPWPSPFYQASWQASKQTVFETRRRGSGGGSSFVMNTTISKTGH